MTTIKICGVTDVENGLVAIDAGADYLGFIFYPPSFRFLTVHRAASLIARLRALRPTGWQAVGVFVNEPLDRVYGVQRACALDVVQLNGEEDAAYIERIAGPVFKSIRYTDPSADGSLPDATALGATRLLLDANVPGMYGGTGVSYDWRKVRGTVADGFLAGGLSPENVSVALEAAHPWGVDVSSGVERDRGKDPELIRAFVRAVREFDRAAESSAKPERMSVV